MENFVTWEMLAVYTSLVTIVYMVVEFIKELSWLSVIRTKYLAWFVAFTLITITNMVLGSFAYIDIILYALTAISISLASNGLHDFNRKVLDEKENKNG